MNRRPAVYRDDSLSPSAPAFSPVNASSPFFFNPPTPPPHFYSISLSSGSSSAKCPTQPQSRSSGCSLLSRGWPSPHYVGLHARSETPRSNHCHQTPAKKLIINAGALPRNGSHVKQLFRLFCGFCQCRRPPLGIEMLEPLLQQFLSDNKLSPDQLRPHKNPTSNTVRINRVFPQPACHEKGERGKKSSAKLLFVTVFL